MRRFLGRQFNTDLGIQQVMAILAAIPLVVGAVFWLWPKPSEPQLLRFCLGEDVVECQRKFPTTRIDAFVSCPAKGQERKIQDRYEALCRNKPIPSRLPPQGIPGNGCGYAIYEAPCEGLQATPIPNF